MDQVVRLPDGVFESNVLVLSLSDLQQMQYFRNRVMFKLVVFTFVDASEMYKLPRVFLGLENVYCALQLFTYSQENLTCLAVHQGRACERRC